MIIADAPFSELNVHGGSSDSLDRLNENYGRLCKLTESTSNDSNIVQGSGAINGGTGNKIKTRSYKKLSRSSKKPVEAHLVRNPPITRIKNLNLIDTLSDSLGTLGDRKENHLNYNR